MAPRKRKGSASDKGPDCNEQGGAYDEVSKKSKRSTLGSGNRNDNGAAASDDSVSTWTVDLVCQWLKAVLNSESAQELFETEEKDTLEKYFRAERINGHVLLNFTDEDRAAFLREAVPAQKGPQLYINKEIQKLVESFMSNGADKGPGACQVFT